MATTLPAGTASARMDLRVQFLRPVRVDGVPLTSRATVVHRGRGLAAARAEVTNEQEKPLPGQPGPRSSFLVDELTSTASSWTERR